MKKADVYPCLAGGKLGLWGERFGSLCGSHGLTSAFRLGPPACPGSDLASVPHTPSPSPSWLFPPLWARWEPLVPTAQVHRPCFRALAFWAGPALQRSPDTVGAEAVLSKSGLLPASRSPFTAVSRAVAQRLTLAICSVVPLEFSLCTRRFAGPSGPVVTKTRVLLDRMRELGPPPGTQRQHHTAASPRSASSRQTVPSTLAQHGFELQAPTKRQIFS